MISVRRSDASTGVEEPDPMTFRRAATLTAVMACVLPAFAQQKSAVHPKPAVAQTAPQTASPMTRPKAGRPQILPSADIRPGMKGTAWTVFAGHASPKPVPIEIIGLWKNAWGPKQDIILAKMGGKAHPHERRRRHERQPGLHRRQADRRGRAAAQRLLAGCDLRHHADRADARDQRFRQVASGGCAHAG